MAGLFGGGCLAHGGEGRDARDAFDALDASRQAELLAFPEKEEE